MKRRELLKLTAKTSLGITLTPSVFNRLLSLSGYGATEVIPHPDFIALADLFLPRTLTPGAVDAKAPEFAMHMIEELGTVKERSKFYEGLEAFQADCIGQHYSNFSDLGEQAQASHLRRLIDNNDPFIEQAHALILTAYFTSKAGMTQALKYDPIPMSFSPCIDADNETRGEAMYS